MVAMPFLQVVLHRYRALTVFNYHDVTNTPTEFQEKYGLYVSEKTFKKQILWIQKHFNVVSPEAILGGKPMPVNAALITFDDGFEGAFNRGFRILGELKVPAIMFLNMYCIESRRPLISSVLNYLEKNDEKFCLEMQGKGIEKPYFINLGINDYTPSEQAISNEVVQYQGKLIDMEQLHYWDRKEGIYFGNHLYDHWNALAQEPEDLKHLYIKNRESLRALKNYIELFAFTNGKPGQAFSAENARLILSLGAKSVFSTHAGVNLVAGKELKGRLALYEENQTDAQLSFRILQALFQSVFSSNEKILGL